MQFLPGTFDEFAVNADPAQPLSPYDPADAIYTAARMLCADGARDGSTAGIDRAIFAYNHADWYVREVMTWASTYAAQDGSGCAPGRPPPRHSSGDILMTSGPGAPPLPPPQPPPRPHARSPKRPGPPPTRGRCPWSRPSTSVPSASCTQSSAISASPPGGSPATRPLGTRPIPLPPGLPAAHRKRARAASPATRGSSLDGVLAAEGFGAVPDPDEPGASLCHAARTAITAWRQPTGTSTDRDTTMERRVAALRFPCRRGQEPCVIRAPAADHRTAHRRRRTDGGDRLPGQDRSGSRR